MARVLRTAPRNLLHSISRHRIEVKNHVLLDFLDRLILMTRT